jgi:hypothetical protein
LRKKNAAAALAAGGGPGKGQVVSQAMKNLERIRQQRLRALMEENERRVSFSD